MKEALSTLLNSWGMDTPPEAIWGLNYILRWAIDKHGFVTDKMFEEEEPAEDHNDNLAKELAEFIEAL